MFQVGLACDFGIVVSQDIPTSAVWFGRAAAASHPNARAAGIMSAMASKLFGGGGGVGGGSTK